MFFVVQSVSVEVPRYTVVDLGVLPAHSSSHAFSVNDNGVVVGECTHDFVMQTPCVWTYDGRVWNVQAAGCCDEGVAVSVASSRCTVMECGDGAMLQAENTCVNVDGLGGPFSAPYAVNAFGTVVGYSLTAQYQGHAFLWKSGGATGGAKTIDLFPDADFSIATDINNAGIVVGLFQNILGNSVAFVRADDGVVVALPTLGGAHASASAINVGGNVVGSARTSGGNTHACVWRRATEGGAWAVHDLAAPPSAPVFYNTTSEAYDINDRDEIIGAVAVGASMHPFIWTSSTGMFELQNLIIPDPKNPSLSLASVRLIRVTSINNHGEIVGWGVVGGDQTEHAVLLIPVRNIQ